MQQLPKNLHSTVVLLKQIHKMHHKKLKENLHSTVVLLKQIEFQK